MLGEKGLTSSEASRIADFIKELVKGIYIDVDTFPVITSTTSRGGKELLLDTNVANPEWKNDLQKKAKLFGLSAWLKEGIKFKEDKISMERMMKFENTKEGIKMIENEEDTTLEYPLPPNESFENYFRTEMNIREQNDYLTQEALASHVGKFIHNFDPIRKKIETFEPVTFRAISSNETLSIENTLLYDKKELYEDIEELISIHRDAEKILNFYKAKHKEWVAENVREYHIKMNSYNLDLKDVNLRNNAAFKSARSEFEIEKTKRLEDLSTLKIVIPNDLQSILDEVLEKLK